jgi:hypothetical protein
MAETSSEKGREDGGRKRFQLDRTLGETTTAGAQPTVEGKPQTMEYGGGSSNQHNRKVSDLTEEKPGGRSIWEDGSIFSEDHTTTSKKRFLYC